MNSDGVLEERIQFQRTEKIEMLNRNLTDFHMLWNYFVEYGLGGLKDVLIYGSPWRYQLED